MKTFFVIRETAEYIVEGETADLALMNFSEHGRSCPQMVLHSRSNAGSTGEKIEAEDLLEALTEHKRNEDRKRPRLS